MAREDDCGRLRVSNGDPPSLRPSGGALAHRAASSAPRSRLPRIPSALAHRAASSAPRSRLPRIPGALAHRVTLAAHPGGSLPQVLPTPSQICGQSWPHIYDSTDQTAFFSQLPQSTQMGASFPNFPVAREYPGGSLVSHIPSCQRVPRWEPAPSSANAVADMRPILAAYLRQYRPDRDSLQRSRCRRAAFHDRTAGGRGGAIGANLQRDITAVGRECPCCGLSANSTPVTSQEVCSATGIPGDSLVSRPPKRYARQLAFPVPTLVSHHFK